MADITALLPDESGLLAAAGSTATAAGGDAVPVLNDGSAYLIAFRNGHTVAIPVTLVGQAGTQVIPGFGKMTKPNQSITVAANGGWGFFKLDKDELSAYMDANGKLQFTYTSHNVALLMVPIKIVL
jgi:hypothetical protein